MLAYSFHMLPAFVCQLTMVPSVWLLLWHLMYNCKLSTRFPGFLLLWTLVEQNWLPLVCSLRLAYFLPCAVFSPPRLQLNLFYAGYSMCLNIVKHIARYVTICSAWIGLPVLRFGFFLWTRNLSRLARNLKYIIIFQEQEKTELWGGTVAPYVLELVSCT